MKNLVLTFMTTPPTPHKALNSNSFMTVSVSPTSVLSIDVGIRNLAMCLIDSDEVIQNWDVSGVPPQHQDGLFQSIRDHLDARPWVLAASTILIEKQPGQNKTMKSVENFLHSYFIIKCPQSETIIYDARHKVPDIAGPGKARYRQRKAAAVDRCRDFIPEKNAHWMKTFTDSKKKDDLADTVLQALSFMRRVSVKAPPKKETALVARKPNENQKATKYSKSNLAWIVKNTKEPEKDKRFMKDLSRYYKDLAELLAVVDTKHGK